MQRLLFTVFLFLVFGAEAGAARAADAISVEGVWARASTGGGRPAAAYMTIRSSGDADNLVSVATAVARRVEIHQSRMEDGVARMAPAGSVAIPAGGSVEFKPGGYHVMLMGLARPLEEGGRFSLTLTFEKAGAVDVRVEIKAAGAMGPGSGR